MQHYTAQFINVLERTVAGETTQATLALTMNDIQKKLFGPDSPDVVDLHDVSRLGFAAMKDRITEGPKDMARDYKFVFMYGRYSRLTQENLAELAALLYNKYKVEAAPVGEGGAPQAPVGEGGAGGAPQAPVGEGGAGGPVGESLREIEAKLGEAATKLKRAKVHTAGSEAALQAAEVARLSAVAAGHAAETARQAANAAHNENMAELDEAQKEHDLWDQKLDTALGLKRKRD